MLEELYMIEWQRERDRMRWDGRWRFEVRRLLHAGRSGRPAPHRPVTLSRGLAVEPGRRAGGGRS